VRSFSEIISAHHIPQSNLKFIFLFKKKNLDESVKQIENGEFYSNEESDKMTDESLKD